MPCLPPNVRDLQNTTLPANYLLQIIDVIDVGHSLHSLLEAATALAPVRRLYVERSQDEQPIFPKAMLKLTLTDGTQEVQAMEYKLIPVLSMNTPLGLKILVKSPRILRGVLILEPHNIEILRGPLPELRGKDIIEEVTRRLKARLGMPARQDGIEHTPATMMNTSEELKTEYITQPYNLNCTERSSDIGHIETSNSIRGERSDAANSASFPGKCLDRKTSDIANSDGRCGSGARTCLIFPKRNLSTGLGLSSLVEDGDNQSRKRRNIGFIQGLQSQTFGGLTDLDDDLSTPLKQNNLDGAVDRQASGTAMDRRENSNECTILETKYKVEAGNLKLEPKSTLKNYDNLGKSINLVANTEDKMKSVSTRPLALIDPSTKASLLSNKPLTESKRSLILSGLAHGEFDDSKARKKGVILSLSDLKHAMSLEWQPSNGEKIFVKASIFRLSQLKLTSSKGYRLIAYLTDNCCATSANLHPSASMTSEVPVLLGLNHMEMIAIQKAEGNVRKHFWRLRDRIVNVEALLELDITSVVSTASLLPHKGTTTDINKDETFRNSESTVMLWAPLVTGYEKMSL
ncbi:hypothetical protein BC937DRAFT_86194 [Endogone sp. FLAS-F59071]|nr:hypothetical protein BC937DRAFT_86194 [Endogone sp. FLAS-F59071]|eukprot:RUS20195.1 hypothetical protein BC937DRAFT_86194 [Endogone sp. FLAS-F59071]